MRSDRGGCICENLKYHQLSQGQKPDREIEIFKYWVTLFDSNYISKVQKKLYTNNLIFLHSQLTVYHHSC
jgi:hypothetical protein